MNEPTKFYPIDSEQAKNYISNNNQNNNNSNSQPQFSNSRYLKIPNLESCQLNFHERLGVGGCGSVYRASLGGFSFALKKKNND